MLSLSALEPTLTYFRNKEKKFFEYELTKVSIDTIKMFRPTSKELSDKLKKAEEAVFDGRVSIIDPETAAEHAIELEYDIELDLQEVLKELLSQISRDEYAGTRPPQKSYKEEIKGLEIFPFVLDSPRFACRVYLKFALQQETFWLISLHKDRPPREE